MSKNPNRIEMRRSPDKMVGQRTAKIASWGACLMAVLVLLAGSVACATPSSRTTIIRHRVVASPLPARRVVQRQVLVVPTTKCIKKGRHRGCVVR